MACWFTGCRKIFHYLSIWGHVDCWLGLVTFYCAWGNPHSKDGNILLYMGNPHSKGGNILLSMGEPSQQGKQNDLIKASAVCQESKGNLQSVSSSHHRGLCQYCSIVSYSEPCDFKTRVIVWTGPPGCDKSQAGCQYVGKGTFYKPWGLVGGIQWAAFILDFFYGWLWHGKMLRLYYRYPMEVLICWIYHHIHTHKLQKGFVGVVQVWLVWLAWCFDEEGE